MAESQYESIVLAAAAFERASDERNDFCRICWGPKQECRTRRLHGDVRTTTNTGRDRRLPR